MLQVMGVMKYRKIQLNIQTFNGGVGKFIATLTIKASV
jgi:hypothetical protein